MNSWTSPVDIRPDHLAIVQEILHVHLPAGFKVWVFGSRANWTTKDSSDLDLAVEGAAKLDHKAMVGLEVAFEESGLPYTVDVVDLKAVSSNFRRIVEGQRVLLPSMGGQVNICDRRHEVALGDVCTKIGSGATPRGGKDVYLEEGGYTLIRSQNVHNDSFHRGGLVFIGEDHANELQHVEVFEEDVLLNITGDSVARVCQVAPDVLPARVNQHVAIIRPDPADLEPSYLRYYLASPAMQTLLLSWAGSGGTRNALTKAMIESLEISLPPLSEQRAVAHVLGTLDDKIELNRRMNRTLEEMARAIYQDWFVDFGPTRAKMEGLDPYLPPELWNLFPDELVDSELGEVPDGWKGGVFSDCVEILSGGTPRTSVPEYWGGNVLWYTPKDAPDLSDIFVLTTERSITMAGVTNSSTQVLPVGTTVISARGTVGRLACLGLPMAMNQTCYGIRGASGYPDYFTYWNVRNTVQDLQARTHGTVFDTITRDTFKIAESILAPPQLAQAYEECIYPLMARILGNAFESFRLTGLRDTLLPRLISGEMNSGDPQN